MTSKTKKSIAVIGLYALCAKFFVGATFALLHDWYALWSWQVPVGIACLIVAHRLSGRRIRAAPDPGCTSGKRKG